MFSLASIDWQPIFQSADGAELLFFIVAGIVIIAVISVIQWRRVRVAEAEASMKMRMIEQGYSPDQIGQVLRVRMDKMERSRCPEN